MGWDATRPVPWTQLIRSWLVYVAIMAVVFLVVFRDRPVAGMMAGLLVSGPLYLGVGAILAKFGYERKTWRQLREEREAGTLATRSSRRSSGGSSAGSSGGRTDGVPGPRPKPAPTKRTGGGSSRPGGKRRR